MKILKTNKNNNGSNSPFGGRGAFNSPIGD